MSLCRASHEKLALSGTTEPMADSHHALCATAHLGSSSCVVSHAASQVQPPTQRPRTPSPQGGTPCDATRCLQVMETEDRRPGRHRKSWCASRAGALRIELVVQVDDACVEVHWVPSIVSIERMQKCLQVRRALFAAPPLDVELQLAAWVVATSHVQVTHWGVCKHSLRFGPSRKGMPRGVKLSR